MRNVLSVLSLGTSLVAAPYLLDLPPALAAAATLAVSVPLTGVCSDGFTPLAIAVGALGALVFQGAAPHSLPVAAALMVTLASMPRAMRARTPAQRGAHVLSSLFCSAIAAGIAAHSAWGGSVDLAVRCAAVLVAGLVASAPRLLPADEPLAYALLGAASDAPESVRTVLLRAVFLRRRVQETPPEGLSTRAFGRLERAWTVLLDAAESRVSNTSRPQTAALVDARITAHVDALERIYAAADERLARTAGLDDGALREASMAAESLEAEVAALAELAHAPEPVVTAPVAVAPAAEPAPPVPAPEAPVAVAPPAVSTAN